MLGAFQAVRRRIAMLAALAVLSVCGVTAAPVVAQESGSDDEEMETASDRAVVELDFDVAHADAATLADALGDIGTNVADQVAALDIAQGNLNTAINALSEADAAVANTEFLIEEKTIQSDEIVTAAFINPPSEDILDTFDEENAVDATIKQSVLDMQADNDADALADLQDARAQLEQQKAAQATAQQDAENLRADAEVAMTNLRAAVSQQTQFLVELRDRINNGTGVGDPALEGRIQELQGQMQAIEDSEAAAAAQSAISAAEARAAQAAINGTIVCPVDGPHNFTDTWGDARSGGRAHKGVDMMAGYRTPTVAPADGRVVHRGTSLGGLSWYVYGDNGHTYYGTHLDGYENEGAGWVSAGTVIGYVGSTGNAGSLNHLHFEIHPNGGSPVNPFPQTSAACEGG